MLYVCFMAHVSVTALVFINIYIKFLKIPGFTDLNPKIYYKIIYIYIYIS